MLQRKIDLLLSGLHFARDVVRVKLGHRPQKPFIAGVTINTMCNLRCSYCFIGRDTEHFPEGFAKPGMDGATIKRIFANIRQDTPCLIITGGEPFLHRDLEELVRYAKHDLRFLNISVATNGLFLEKKSECLKFIDRLGISYDLTRAREYPKEMSRMLQSLPSLKKARILPPVHFTMTLLRNEELSPLAEFCAYCKTNNFRLWLQPEREHGDFVDWEWFVEAVERIAADFGHHLILNNLAMVRRFRNKHTASLCLPELRVHVSEDGNLMYPCHRLEHLHQGGSVIEETPMKLWRNAEQQAGAFPNQACGNCGFSCYFETAGLYHRPFNFARKAIAHLSGT